jgi:lambda repressor-like predicted transcriptional regulator
MKGKTILKLVEQRRTKMGISRRELSTRAGLSHATYASLSKPNHEMSLRVAASVLGVVGLQILVGDADLSN